MGTAYYIVLEREIDGLDTGIGGKCLTNNIESLDDAARTLWVRPLSEFFSAAPETLAGMMEDAGVEVAVLPPLALKQFTAAEGLATIRALLPHLAAQSDGVQQDLRECERILGAAAKHGVGWHFEIDL
jgi:hypothetical protein